MDKVSIRSTEGTTLADFTGPVVNQVLISIAKGEIKVVDLNVAPVANAYKTYELTEDYHFRYTNLNNNDYITVRFKKGHKIVIIAV